MASFALAALGAAVAVSAALVAGAMAERTATARLLDEARVAADLRAASLRSELARQRTAPFALAQDGDVAAALSLQTPADLARLNGRLERLADRMNTSAIYILNAKGVAVASSNWRSANSFLGDDYSFRAYYSGAMERGEAEMFALGSTTGVPGFYISQRVDGQSGPLGVVVIKVAFEALEAEWEGSGAATAVTDARGDVIVTSVPDWRFKALPFEVPPQGLARLAQPAGGRFAHGQADGGAPGWRLHVLWPADRAIADAATTARTIAFLAVALVAIAIAYLRARRARARAQSAARESMLAQLEDRVAERTQALTASNAHLSREIEERRRAESTLHLLQEELIQANKLAVLGQIAAGVAHEINQPVAAIRTYVDNASVMLQGGDQAGACDNLARVATLTERVGLITAELKGFGRRSRGAEGPTDLAAALEGALLLLGARIRHADVEVIRVGLDKPVLVAADRVRLEQVAVNLIQNALDALRGRPNPRLTLTIAATPEGATLRVEDNGPGLDLTIAEALFTPFRSTKEEGLGLGLVISRDIMVELGGDLVHAPAARGGAAFEARMRRA